MFFIYISSIMKKNIRPKSEGSEIGCPKSPRTEGLPNRTYLRQTNISQKAHSFIRISPGYSLKEDDKHINN